MYLVKIDEVDLAYVENPVWIKKMNNGCFGLTDRQRATGIVVAGTPYTLGVSDDMSELELVTITKLDGGSLLAQYMANLDYLSAMTGVDLPEEDAQPSDEETSEDEKK